jgi:sugar phosphate isomerase/epimerase
VKLGLGSYAFAWSIGVPGHVPAQPMDVFGLLEAAVRLKVRVIQVCDNLPLADLAPERLAEFESRARDSGIAVEVGMRGLQPDEVRRYLALAVRCGSPFLRLVVDRPDDHPAPDEVIARVRALLPEFRRAGVKLAIENHDRFSASTLAEIVGATDPAWVGICLDTVNSLGALEGPDIVVRTLGRYILSLHVKDFVIRRVPSMMGFVVTGAPAGEGRLDVPWLLRELRATGRPFNAIIETWPPFGPTLDATIALEHAWVETSVRNLRAWIHD